MRKWEDTDEKLNALALVDKRYCFARKMQLHSSDDSTAQIVSHFLVSVDCVTNSFLL